MVENKQPRLMLHGEVSLTVMLTEAGLSQATQPKLRDCADCIPYSYMGLMQDTEILYQYYITSVISKV